MNMKNEAMKVLEESLQKDTDNSEVKEVLNSLKETEDKRVKNNRKIIYLSK